MICQVFLEKFDLIFAFFLDIFYFIIIGSEIIVEIPKH